MAPARPPDDSQIPELDDLAEEPTGVIGTLRAMPLPDVIQGLANQMKDALIEVKPRVGAHGQVYLRQGQIVFCERGQLVGEEALYSLIALDAGTFRVRYARPAPGVNITRETTFLLLEAARILDEKRGSAALPPKREANALPESDDPMAGLVDPFEGFASSLAPIAVASDSDLGEQDEEDDPTSVDPPRTVASTEPGGTANGAPGRTFHSFFEEAGLPAPDDAKPPTIAGRDAPLFASTDDGAEDSQVTLRDRPRPPRR